MPNNTRLLKKQRPTVEAWASSRQGKIIKVIDRSCNYRDTLVEWQEVVIQGNGQKEVIIFYETLLELTPSGKIRREQTERVKVIYRNCISFPTWLQLTLPFSQAQLLPPPPPTIQRKYLYNVSMLTMTYEYKLQPTVEQIAIIEQTLDVCRRVWNFALRQRKDWCASRKSPINACSIQSEYIITANEPFPSYHQQAKQLTSAKKQYPQLKTVHSQVLQQTLRILDRAWDDMKSRGFGFPRFKNKYRMRSFVFPQLGKDPIRNDAIKFPRLGAVQWRQSRPIPEGFELKQARIVRKASGYFVMLSLQLNVNVPNPLPHGHPRGLDLGFDKFVATSDGDEIKRPRFLKTLQRKLKLLQRRLKNKRVGSNNRHQLNQKIAKLHQRISDTRKDWHFKLSHRLVKDAGMLFVEDINFVSWQRGMLSKHSADAGFGQFVNILQWVCWKEDVYFAKVNKNGTSQTCPNCGAHTGKKTLDVRIHHCSECGYRTTRDVAASQEIRNRGISALGHSVVEKVCGLEATGSIGHDTLVGTGRSRNPASRGVGIPFFKVTEHSEVA